MVRILAVAALVSTAAAQAPVVGDINFYGLRRITPDRILGTLKLGPGDRLPGSKADMEDAIAEIPGVVLSRVEAVCCEGPRVSLFIGIEERSAAHAVFRSSPAGSAVLPQDIMDSYDAYLTATQRAAVRGASAAPPPDSQIANYASEHLDLLHDVLRNASGAEHRAVAAALLQFAPKTQAVVDDLQYALQDSDETVRANAVRSLAAVGEDADTKLKIAPTWLVELLNSIMLSDRIESAKALLVLTDHGNPGVLDLLRERALPSLTEMARWNSPKYALPSFLLLGRLAGMPDADVQEYWKKGDREPILQKAATPASRKPPA
jgi:hypothetical protein